MRKNKTKHNMNKTTKQKEENKKIEYELCKLIIQAYSSSMKIK